MSDRADALHQQLLDQVTRLRTSEEWLQAMTMAARFRDYSLGNWLLLWCQAEQRGTTVTQPAGYRRWQSLGRQVRKGEKGYHILAPVTRRVKVDRADGEDTELRLIGFRVVTVFDISQTDGEPLPDIGPRLLTGDADAGLLEAAISMIEDAGYSYSLGPLRGPNGVTRPLSREVVVDGDLEGVQLVKTTIHELAHIQMHAEADRIECRGSVEVEAESVAYVVCAAAGLDTSAYSVAYVAGWAERTDDPDKALLATAERVVTESRRILGVLKRSQLLAGESKGSEQVSSNQSVSSDMMARAVRSRSKRKGADMIVTVVGNLCADPELRETSGGVPVADLRIAENRNYQDPAGRWQQTSAFYSVVVWRKVAEHAAASLHRGDRVVAVGRMRQEEWTTEAGRKHQRYVVDADELAASVRFANVIVSKADEPDPTEAVPT